MFLYVFDEATANALSAAGYVLLRKDDSRSLYVFVYDRGINFDLDNTKHVFSSTLTF